MNGKVYIVGAGPGDRELLTLKAKRLIEEADVIVHDRLIGRDILDFASKDCQLIYVGKGDSFRTVEQSGINDILVEKANEGKKVVRLKGGDPFIFGRGGEETLFLAKHNIPFEVVPGITAAVGIGAYTGIPLTDRNLSSAVTLVTGHSMKGTGLPDVDWSNLAGLDHTIVFYMGLKNLPVISKNLIQNGKPADTPVAVVRWGTVKEQVVVTATLDKIAIEVTKANITPPALVIIGKVVSYRDVLNWYQGDGVAR